MNFYDFIPILVITFACFFFIVPHYGKLGYLFENFLTVDFYNCKLRKERRKVHLIK